jgi:outer membrane protein assembly factor BamB
MHSLKNLVGLVMGLILFAGCAKKSTDTPLPKSRKVAIYVTTDNNNLISYNPETGEKYWEVNFKGPCVGTNVIHNKRLYSLTSNGYLYCIDLIEGKIVREVNTSLLIPSPSTFENNSLAAENGKLFIAADKMYCLDTLGVVLWNYDPGGYCTSSPTIKNGKLFFCAAQSCRCLDLAGNVIWSSTPVGTEIFSSPIVSNSVVYFGADDKKVHALNEADGSIKWEYSTFDDVISSPLIYGGMCLIGSNDRSLYCVDTTTGLLRWSYQTAERVISSPAIHEFSNTVIVGSYDFNLYGINHVDGLLKWKFPAGSLIKSSPVMYGNLVLFTAFDRYLYCVDARNGKLVWKQYTNGNCQGSPIIDDLKSGLYPTISGQSQY